jgi:phospholipid/cholesterol/gamma-HCH transport system permease protein
MAVVSEHILRKPGIFLTGLFDWIGFVVLRLQTSLFYILTGRVDLALTYKLISKIGFDGLPVSLLITFIAGSVLALQTADKFARTGAEGYVGGLVAIAVCREMSPIFTCLTVGAQSGTAIAAELAHWQITSQTDALQVLRVDPVRILMAPRVLACLVALPLMTLLCNVSAMAGGMLVARFAAHLHPAKYLESVWLMLRPFDIVAGGIKALVFALLMVGVSCSLGLRAKGGAAAVGRSATLAAVWTAMLIMVADFLLTWFLFIQSGVPVNR